MNYFHFLHMFVCVLVLSGVTKWSLISCVITTILVDNMCIYLLFSTVGQS